jgi:hypothetical protein
VAEERVDLISQHWLPELGEQAGCASELVPEDECCGLPVRALRPLRPGDVRG